MPRRGQARARSAFQKFRSKKSMMPTRVLPMMPACCHRCALVICTSSETKVPVPTVVRGRRLIRSGCCTYSTDPAADRWSTAPAGIKACTRWPSTEPVTVPPRSLITRSTAELSEVSTSTETRDPDVPSIRRASGAVDFGAKLGISTRTAAPQGRLRGRRMRRADGYRTNPDNDCNHQTNRTQRS